MLTSKEVSTSLETAYVIAEKTPKTLSSKAKLLYMVLLATAIETAKERGYSPSVSFVTLHLPLEQLARACGISRVSVWRHLPALHELGVLDHRAHKGSCRGETRNTGTLFMVRLDPVRGSKCRLSFDDLKHKWRDLDADIKRGRRSYDLLQHTKVPDTDLIDIESLLIWTLPPQCSKDPVKPVCCSSRHAALEALLDVVPAPKEERNQMVALAAQALAQALSDQNSVSWYQKLLWQLLRRFDSTGDDYSYKVYLVAQRAKTDALEGFARRPGALFHSRLKKADWFDWIMDAPPNRVGSKPN